MAHGGAAVKTVPRRFGIGVITCLLLLSGAVVGFLGLLPIPTVDVRWDVTTREAGGYQPALRTGDGPEILLVAIVASGCYWSNLPETAEAVRMAKDLVAAQAEAKGVGFVAMGVARDVRVEAGLKHLERHGPFDEVIAGRGWLNSGVLQFIYNDEIPGLAATPQIVVLEQRAVYEAGARRIVARREVLRKLGPTEIAGWVAAGAPVSRLE